MSVCFEGPGGIFRWRIYQLAVLMDLARTYGWSGPSTLPPTDWPTGTPWDGNYTSGHGQRVTHGDALALASALEAALPNIPDANAIPYDKVVMITPHRDDVSHRLRQVGDEVEEEDSDAGLENMTDWIAVPLPSGEITNVFPVRWVGEQIWGFNPEIEELTPSEVFSGENKAELVEFIAFCRQGGFVVCER